MKKNSTKSQFKNCLTCQRSFNNRKSWESRGIWDEVMYCSVACRKYKDNVEYKKKFTS